MPLATYGMCLLILFPFTKTTFTFAQTREQMTRTALRCFQVKSPWEPNNSKHKQCTGYNVCPCFDRCPETNSARMFSFRWEVNETRGQSSRLLFKTTMKTWCEYRPSPFKTGRDKTTATPLNVRQRSTHRLLFFMTESKLQRVLLVKFKSLSNGNKDSKPINGSCRFKRFVFVCLLACLGVVCLFVCTKHNC